MKLLFCGDLVLKDTSNYEISDSVKRLRTLRISEELYCLFTIIFFSPSIVLLISIKKGADFFCSFSFTFHLLKALHF